MTTIAAIQGEGFSVICADSRIADVDSDGYIVQLSTLKEGATKVALNGKYLLGAAGDLRAINLLHHAFHPPVLPAGMKEKNLGSFFTNRFVPALRKCFESSGYVVEGQNGNNIAEHGSVILVSIMGSIYIVDRDYSWMSDSSGIYALGTGASYALGAMHSLYPKDAKLSIKDAEDLCIHALEVASKLDPYTGSPFHTFVQKRK